MGATILRCVATTLFIGSSVQQHDSGQAWTGVLSSFKVLEVFNDKLCKKIIGNAELEQRPLTRLARSVARNGLRISGIAGTVRDIPMLMTSIFSNYTNPFGMAVPALNLTLDLVITRADRIRAEVIPK